MAVLGEIVFLWCFFCFCLLTSVGGRNRGVVPSRFPPRRAITPMESAAPMGEEGIEKPSSLRTHTHTHLTALCPGLPG